VTFFSNLTFLRSNVGQTTINRDCGLPTAHSSVWCTEDYTDFGQVMLLSEVWYCQVNALDLTLDRVKLLTIYNTF